ncbi:helix-turn-helix transcriptional regulator [Streptomyces sp. NPDC051561]|uniref:helix-turn-helix transcriptional regulator n=1 Tax=Streptomyces sp. NPDC051561 TaxID=3365658 RepID=UPI0037BBD757
MPHALFRHPRGAQVDSALAVKVCGPSRRKAAGEQVAAPRLSDKLTVDQVCAELGIAKSSFYDWRQKGRAPRCIRLPNGALRIRRSDLENWLADCEDRT